MKTSLHCKLLLIGVIVQFLFSVNSNAQWKPWHKLSDNPVITQSPWTNNAFYPIVLCEDDIYKMWFSSGSNGFTSIAYAESMNGIDWEVDSFPVIEGDEGGDWQIHKGPGAVLRVNDTLKMWYTGSSDGFNIDLAIGYAYFDESSSRWVVRPDPVLEKGALGSWDAQGVVNPVAYYDGSMYYMWYHGFENPSLYAPCGIGQATSTDGINWTKNSMNPLMIPELGTFYSTWNMPNSLLYREDEYQMWFSGWDGIQSPWHMKIGYATSPNGLTWTVQNDRLCVLDVGPSGSWDSGEARMASVQEYNDTLRMWYVGMPSGIGFSGSKIGYAWQDIPVGINQNDISFSLRASISPNPCRDYACLKYDKSYIGDMKIELYDISGNLIQVLMDGVKPVGDHTYAINMLNNPDGLYLVKIYTENHIETLKLVKID